MIFDINVSSVAHTGQKKKKINGFKSKIYKSKITTTSIYTQIFTKTVKHDFWAAFSLTVWSNIDREWRSVPFTSRLSSARGFESCTPSTLWKYLHIVYSAVCSVHSTRYYEGVYARLFFWIFRIKIKISTLQKMICIELSIIKK